MGHIYLIIGKSASGKDSVYRSLIQDPECTLHRIVTYTTRPMREGETEGKEYHFVSQEILEDFRKNGQIVEERVYETVYGPWTYFTADDGQIDLKQGDYLCIGTLESLTAMKDFYGDDRIVPIYIEVEDGVRLSRAIERERAEEEPKLEEVCRRFLADQKDFSEENLQKAKIEKRFENRDLEETIEMVRREIYGYKSK